MTNLLKDNEHLMAEYNYDKNIKLNIDNVLIGSSKKIWWKCKYGHEWLSTPNNRKNGNNCPYCSNQKILEGYNDLQTTHPELLSEWNYKKNTIKPTEVSYGSGKKVWWICEFGHEYQISVDSRVNGKGCPICLRDLQISFPEKCVYYYIKKYYCSAKENYHIDFLKKQELDIYIPELKIAFEYDGTKWHQNLNKDLEKFHLCNSNGILLYRIREFGCPDFDNKNWLYLENNKIETLEKKIEYILKYILNIDNPNVNVKKDRIKIYELMRLGLKENSLYILNPELSKEWNYNRNGQLVPQQFSSQSSKIVWWIGNCNHEWQASIYSRTSGSGCPFCSNTKVLSGYNDLKTTHPQLLAEWDNAKNVINPTDLMYGSDKYVWWKCKNGHSWKSYPYKKNKCPFCSNKKLLTGYNDLRTINPELCADWNYEKNYPLKPENIIYGSNKRVWWKCKKCGHEWQACISHRNAGRSCDICMREVRKDKQLKTLLSKSENITSNRKLVSLWNYEKNEYLDQDNVLIKSNKKIWWKCKNGHEWQETPALLSKENIGCPYCSGRRLLSGFNDFATRHPSLVNEWDYQKNIGIDPYNIGAGSKQKVWWKCKKGHEWQATINNRTSLNRGCPYCSDKSKKIIQLNKNGDILSTYKSISIASKKTGINNSSISAVCNGKRKTAGNYYWKFDDNKKDD